MKLSLIFLMLYLSACATTYSKSGASPRDFNHDHNDCKVKAGQAGYTGGGFANNMHRISFIKECMSGQGWDNN